MPAPSKTDATANPHFQKLARLIVQSGLTGDLEGFGPKDREQAAGFAMQALDKRAAGEVSIAIDTIASEAGHRRMRMAIVNDDMPFLVDSVAAIVSAQGLVIDRLLHPVAKVERDGKGRLAALGGGTGKAESIIYLEADRADARVRVRIREEIQANLAEVRAAVADWREMQAAMRGDARAEGRDQEVAALFDWLVDDNFTLLGHALCGTDGSVSAPLGIARNLGENLLSAAARKRALAWFRAGKGDVLAIKSNLLSPVHRRVPLDLFIVPSRENGAVSGLSIHTGLWTSASLAKAPDETPMLRRRLSALLAKHKFNPAGHTGKALLHAMASLPHDILVSINAGDMERLVMTAMSLADRPRPKAEIAAAPLDRHLFAFVWLPRDDLTTERREAIAGVLLRATGARLLNWSVDLGDGEAALIRFTLDIRDGTRFKDASKVDAEIATMLRGWNDAVEASLSEIVDSAHATRLALRYAPALPLFYRTGAGPVEAARDIDRIDRLDGPGGRQARLYRNPGDADAQLRLKLYSATPIALSEAVPALENFGFTVLEELTTALSGGLGHIQRLVIETVAAGGGASVLGEAARIERALVAVLEGRAEDDAFNRLIVELGLDMFAVTLLRAIFRYLRQTGVSYGLLTVVDALRRAPGVTRAIVAMFAARFDPAARKGAEKREADALAAINAGLAQVAAIDDDRILRLMRSVVAATLRTNAYAPAAAEALAFKIESAKVPGLPAPLPWREMWVYSPRVEGIHLRAGPVARGGLRWSDRRDDFRTEILGLMKAQRVKNAVIVPTGAKGGFYPKQLPDTANREAWLAEGTESYRIFIRTLLSVTDNLKAGKCVHPDAVVCHDGDDPYFVVAADKGTATFSDVANAIAESRGFWLGDAFASGGSNGYDHKAMGITAKGAWVSVVRHFAEMGIDVQRDPVTVAGVGDMSGDVFGNGMLLSKAIKLVAAFDHRHIFIDPDPDPAKSWKERARMFTLPRSSWADYDRKLISKGGGIFARSEKEIAISPEIRALLGIAEDRLEPSQLISAILKARVDLIWFGGIGTYVKAAGESNSEVGDRANDAHRVNAEDLRARVIGEGANLGVTQAARIAFALKGGRINTDFIDNSAGVDCSDNEVNIKIALNAAEAAKALTRPERNRLLARMTDQVGEIVLEDNRLQTLALSVAEKDGAAKVPAFIRLIEQFEASGRLDRAVEGIAANDVLARRTMDGKGLTRPELAVLLSTAKLALQDAIEHSQLGRDPAAAGDLTGAFPAAMRKRFARQIGNHQLRNEIIATKLANRIVNRLGIIHPLELAEEEGRSLGEVAEAFVIAEQVYGIGALWRDIDATDVGESTRLMLFEQVAVEMRAHMADILRNAIESRSNDKAVAAYKPLVDALSKQRDKLMPAELRQQMQAYRGRLQAAGAPAGVADRLVRLAELDGAIGLAALSARSKLDAVALTRAFTAIGSATGIDWAQGTAMSLSPTDPWERLLVTGVARDFQAMRLDFIARVGGRKPAENVTRWIGTHAEPVSAFNKMIGRARESAAPTPAMLAQIASQARGLLAKD